MLCKFYARLVILDWMWDELWCGQVQINDVKSDYFFNLTLNITLKIKVTVPLNQKGS